MSKKDIITKIPTELKNVKNGMVKTPPTIDKQAILAPPAPKPKSKN